MAMEWAPGARRAFRFAGRPESGGVLGGRGPEAGTEPVLEAGECVEVGPDGAVEDGGDGGVVDSGEDAGLAQAPVVESSAQVERDSACGLGFRVRAGRVGPAVGEFDGGRPGGAGHISSVGLAPRLSLMARGGASGDRAPSASVGSNQRKGDPVAATIDGYAPDLPSAEWKQIAAFVRAAVRDCDQKTPYQARELLVVSARFVHWCVFTACHDLDRETIFHRDVIGEYAARGCPQMTAASAGNRRSQLLRMAETLAPQTNKSPLAALPPSAPVHPYQAREVAALRSWATGQTTLYRQVNCGMLLALGLGAGLSAREAGDVQARHIHVDSEGVLLEVVGARPRIVPVLAEWEPALETLQAAAIRPELHAFRPKREVNHRNLVGNFIGKTNVGQVVPNLQRMRATWIVTHLAAGSPVKPLVEAAGVDSLEALTRYLRYLPDADINDYRNALREADGTANLP